MFLRRQKVYLGEYNDKVIYYNRKTREMLEAPKSKQLDTEKSARLNRPILRLAVMFVFCVGGILSFLALLHQKEVYSPENFWSVMIIWLAEFLAITGFKKRGFYKNVKQARLMNQTNFLQFVDDHNEKVRKQTGFSVEVLRTLAFLVFLVGFGYAFYFIFNKHNNLLEKPVGSELFKFLFAGVLLGISSLLYNQGSLVRKYKIIQRFRNGKLKVICRESDEEDTLVELRARVKQIILSEKMIDMPNDTSFTRMMFLRRRRVFLSEGEGGIAIYYDRKTRELLEAPKSRLLDTEKSTRMNRHIPRLVVLLMSSGGGIASFFAIFLHGTYTSRGFWYVLAIWLAEFVLLVGIVERGLYKNVGQAHLMTRSKVESIMGKPEEDDAEEEKTEEDIEFGFWNYLHLRTVLFLVPMISFFYAFSFVISYHTLVGKPIGKEIFEILFLGIMFAAIFIIYNQNSPVRTIQIIDDFDSGRSKMVCKESEEDDTFVEVRSEVERTIVSEKIERSRRQTK